MKIVALLSIFIAAGISCNSPKKTSTMEEISNIYQFKPQDISGNIFDFSHLKGKKIMIVNTASKCGFTKQYADLEELYQKYKENDFIIIGFPSNDFLWQEPGSNQEIAEFCRIKYGVSFPMMSKISVKGRNIHPLFKFLTEKKQNGKSDSKVKWNFQKFLIDRQGNLSRVFPPSTSPVDKEILDWIEKN